MISRSAKAGSRVSWFGTPMLSGPVSGFRTHGKGANPFGVEALIGTVRQMTDEVADDHTSNLILKGGSHYQPEGSHWEAYPRDGGIESGIAKQDSGCTQPERS